MLHILCYNFHMLPEYFGYLPILISIFGVVSYIKAIYRGTVRPNLVSWIFWAIAPLIGVYVSYQSGVSIPLLVSTFVAGFMPAVVVVFALFKKNGYFKATVFDLWCGLFSAIAIGIWITTKNPFLSLTFAILADLLAGIPTIIKSWRDDHNESIGPYLAATINQVITLLIITNFAFVNYSFPVYLILLNVLIIWGIKKKKLHI